MTRINRRRFFAIAAAVAAAPGAAFGAASVTRWRGVALGAGASMTLTGIAETEAAPVIGRVMSEISRMEEIFSLYRPASPGHLSGRNVVGEIAEPIEDAI